MANITAFPFLLSIVGDGASLSATVMLVSPPASASLLNAFSASGADVSSNVASVVVAGSSVVFTFNSAFTGTISVELVLTNGNVPPQLVTGVFFQATQPVSGTFFQGTQPVSIATMPSTPVTGTFWQATQPVSIATMPTTPVTGTFWQTTQPISGAVSFTAPQHVILDSEAQSDSVGSLYTNAEGRKATYSACAIFSPGAAGDVAVLPGSATKTIRVLRVEFSCSTSGTAQIQTIQLIKRSTADTGGTSAAVVAVPHDSLFPAASAAPRSYTAAPSLGTLVGPVRAERGNDPTSISSGGNLTVWTFGTEPGGSTIVLRGVAQQLCVNMASVPSVQTVTAMFTWTEE